MSTLDSAVDLPAHHTTLDLPPGTDHDVGACTAAHPATGRGIDSPRIAAVARRLRAGDDAALDEFWRELEDSSGPLMEPADDDGTTLVTFVWRDPGDTDNVLVIFFTAADGDDVGDVAMSQVEGTDLWYLSYRLPSDLRTTYLLSVNDPMIPLKSYAELMERLDQYRSDPLNPDDYTLISNPNEFRVSVLELPNAPRQPWNIPRRGVERGRCEMHRMDSEILGTTHHIGVYLPPGYDPDAADGHDMFVLFDGWTYYNFASITTVLDNLLHVGRIPSYVLVMHTNEDQEIRARELPCYAPFHDYLVGELMPWVHESYNVTADPRRTVIGGSCFGAIAAAYAAFRSPDQFGNVISQSGSYWWPGPDRSDLEGEWLVERFAESPRLPIRFSMEIGCLEEAILNYNPMVSHRRMRDVLMEKGYEVDYDQYVGGHDMICWRGSIVDRLLSFHPKESVDDRRNAAG